MALHLRSIRRTGRQTKRGDFPFNVPLIRSFKSIEFVSPVTFLVGENGSGKSTLLEAIACAVGSIAVGSADVEADSTLKPLRELGATFKQTWSKRTNRGFFLRAEDFFGFARRLMTIKHDSQQAMAQVDRDYEGRSELAKGLAKGPHARTLYEMEAQYGEGLDAQSHGESFLKLFQSRVVDGGLYLLDEPEAPLSPLRQLALISLLKEMVERECQFIIATHSPILLAFPGATIWSCDSNPIEPVQYEDLEHVNLTREFLNDPDRYLKQL